MDYEANFKDCKWVDEITVADYPSGRLRTQCTWTVETKTAKSGKTTQRVSRVTINPKTSRPCAPKKTTYSKMIKLCQANDGFTYILEYDGDCLDLSLGTLQALKRFYAKEARPTELMKVFDLIAIKTPSDSGMFIPSRLKEAALSKNCTLIEG